MRSLQKYKSGLPLARELYPLQGGACVRYRGRVRLL